MMYDYYINSPEKIEETQHVFEITNLEYKNILAQEIKESDRRWGYKFKEYSFINNYENDDYLIVAYLLQTFRKLHHNLYYHPIRQTWLKGNSEIPYIHLNFEQIPVMKEDSHGNKVAYDAGLNMGVTPPLFNGTHQLNFNHYWLKRYMIFLQTIFDKNEEWYTPYPDYVPRKTIEYADESELILLSCQLERYGLKNPAKFLRIYAKGAYDGKKIPKPELVFIDINGKRECVTWGFYDAQRHGFSIPAKKGIFNTSGFAPLFFERNDFIVELYETTVKFILGHETAHVARGHSLLKKYEPEFAGKRDVMMNCELNADWTSAHWLLDELLFHTRSGDINDPVLAYTAEKITYMWALRIFACYMALSWCYRDDRSWSKDIIRAFRADMNKTHPIYNLRLYNMLGKVKNHITNDYVLGKRVRDKDPKIVSADNIPINEFADRAWDRAIDMIMSFESAFRVTWDDDERDILKKIKDGMFIEDKSAPESSKQIPFMLAYTNDAQAEFAQYELLWQEIRQKLNRFGAAYVN